MKKNYESPVLELLSYTQADILTASENGQSQQSNTPITLPDIIIP